MTIIVNPAAGNGRCGKLWENIRDSYIAQKSDINIVYSSTSGEATDIASSAIDKGETTLVAVGGDGTINEVVNGFFRNSEVINQEAKLGIIPLGTGSDFHRSLNSSFSVDSILDYSGHNPTTMCDLGLVSCLDFKNKPVTRYFINVADAGFGAAVVANSKNKSRALNARLLYLKAVLTTLLKYRPTEIRSSIDGGRPRSSTLLTFVVANGKYFGGGIQVAPDASPDSGDFQTVRIASLSLLNLIVNIAKLYNGKIAQHSKVRVGHAKSIQLSGTGVPLETDGELIGKLPATITIKPAALAVLK